ncbi:similar to Saccharomyces cerevisiae YPL227C ALG5 UDP-glucose:dolichyl-phosphate glucosyltransferase, involved in asparagine-linked glycosylation in the endoplasmic reticulum [Maudiozyma barnettii]|uniref:dolichyl-phosphate beta-glucosyltransferase n=1 Tax=Maudiozyma barnettii TaxID=61262 RepID=A0A8H2ZH55_9SACH|nr:dolichyl-phosphate beta-glucosyltransferase [Kazachstania barnettii]CAB4255369.1 similar to Saccharomyces cerevisiae YPL227C ALG5 UDP-glucose:dolichyl-phosphate glucosyltransferase, involved in asparagine-linked glycosylation in the endoplasmic reticulum [Kazachstania barnettii]CAD1783775.1 similar to Saccharomyces cerevisiae YPL227C ALG5 UDP-glucose:dolichyl-phosphate glucosyltransferase, involved in asparagine-linked glycosylation in the endoplasmic reticulum [Kazachstania barnettii]
MLHLIKETALVLHTSNITYILGTLIIAGFVSVYVIVILLSHSPRKAHPEELKYTTCDENGDLITDDLPSSPADGIILSVVVPSYNETGRILAMLTDAIEFLQKALPEQWEILIVDDGSSDGTSDYCLRLSHEIFKLKANQLRVLKFTENRGKGGAVRQGLLHIRGKYGLFADADGASKFNDAQSLLDNIKEMEKSTIKGEIYPTMAIGSRAHMVNTAAVIKRSFIRNCLMYGFHTLVWVFGIHSINDTQCGFKMFNREAIDEIFPYLHTEGWIFDIEILLLGIIKNIKFKEIPVSWHEVGGSKMDLAIDSLKMAKDLVIIRMAYILGIYNANKEC